MMRILLAEDDVKLAQHIRRGLTEAAYAVDVAHDGNEAIWLAESCAYDAMVVDIMMPGKDGVTVVRHLRRHHIATPVIFLTARSAIDDRIQGLDAGGDDYLTKPFSMLELLARIRALLRRQRPTSCNTMRVHDLELDLVSRKARRGAVEIELTNRDFALLELLMRASPNPVGKTTIIERVWDQHFDSGTNIVNVYVNHLRRKIDQQAFEPLIHTVRGVGFAIHGLAVDNNLAPVPEECDTHR
jgi:two-component system copper resistance phosphate regulon response regulator CusR